MLLRNAAKVFPEEGYAVVGPRLQALASEGNIDFKVLHPVHSTAQSNTGTLLRQLCKPWHSWRCPCHATPNDTCAATNLFSPNEMKPPSQPKGSCCIRCPGLQCCLTRTWYQQHH